MNVIEKDIRTALKDLPVQSESGIYQQKLSDEYIVVTPIIAQYRYADDAPFAETQEARITVYAKASYTKLVSQIIKMVQSHGFIIADRQYVSFDTTTNYNVYCIDVLKFYDVNLEEDY